MSKVVKLGTYHVEYCPDNNEVCCSDYEVDEFMWFSKQDLLDMLKLFEEQEQENK